jgi:hypothetical protein
MGSQTVPTSQLLSKDQLAKLTCLGLILWISSLRGRLSKLHGLLSSLLS